MVLYDKKSNFLGIGQNELFILGYEDMVEFKSYHNDFADLFVNHPGYISKFKNFSWIDYALHSGVSNKNVLLKHKNGTEIEATLDIMEIFLLDEINESSILYNIEINISKLENDFATTTKPYLQNQNTELEPILEEPIAQKKAKVKDTFSLVSDFEIEDYKEAIAENEKNESSNEPFSIESNSDFEIKENIPEDAKVVTQKSADSTIKLKVDMFDDIDETEKIEDILKIQAPEKTYKPEDKIEIKTQNDSNISDEKNHTGETNNFAEQYEEADGENIDFAQIIDDTGINLEDLAKFMDEFLGESKKMSEILHLSKDKQSIKNEILQLKGIASSLKMINFVKLLNMISNNYDTEKFYYYVSKFDSKIKNLKNQLS